MDLYIQMWYTYIRGDKVKDVAITIRIPKELRERFNKVCTKKLIKRSEWLRLQVETFVKENEK